MSLPSEYYENKKEPLTFEETLQLIGVTILWFSINVLFVYFNN